MSEINLAFVGSGKTLRNCIDEVKQYNRRSTEFSIHIKHVFIDPSKGFFDNKLPEQLNSEGISASVAEKINSSDTIQTIKKLNIDYLISVNNHQILKKELINAPERAVLNFHNGPLPKYGGLNACTWAIYNNESKHGVTWHYMSEKIDQGEIIVQSFFDIENSDTAISLIMKSITEGVKLFRALLPEICKDNLVSYKQDLTKRTYYSNKDIPNSGYIDYSWGFQKFMRFKRAFSFYPFENLLGPPKLKIADQTYKLLEYDYLLENTQKIVLGQIHYDEVNLMLLIRMSEGVLAIKKIFDHKPSELFLKHSSSTKS
jgi:methionyl-tRNA formyltransferase